MDGLHKPLLGRPSIKTYKIDQWDTSPRLNKMFPKSLCLLRKARAQLQDKGAALPRCIACAMSFLPKVKGRIRMNDYVCCGSYPASYI